MIRCLAIAAAVVVLLAVPARAGFDEGLAAYKHGDYAASFREMEPLAEGGLADAQFFLAVMYQRGQGVPPNFVLAYTWASLAVAQLPEGARREGAQGILYLSSKKMTREQLARAQQRAASWRAHRPFDQSRQPGGDQTDRDAPQPDSAGSGFAISRHGHIVTNAHVVDGCRQVRARHGWFTQNAIIVAQDVANDLALLLLRTPVAEPLPLRGGNDIRPGDGVIVIGFPLTGLLASGPNVTTGTVSALAGIGNDTRFLQITAPVQPGSSGGPVLDMTGRLIGIVAAKLNELKVAQVTGNFPQNVNFAINTRVISGFLDVQGIAYQEAKQGRRLDAADVAAAGIKATLLVECWR